MVALLVKMRFFLSQWWEIYRLYPVEAVLHQAVDQTLGGRRKVGRGGEGIGLVRATTQGSDEVRSGALDAVLTVA